MATPASAPPSATRTVRLRQSLVWPFVALVVVLSVLIGTLSYLAGGRAVDKVSVQLLHDTVTRIEQSVYLQLTGANSRLEIAMPLGLKPPPDIAHHLDGLAQRLWLAATPVSSSSPYVYFANTQGQFIGTLRDGTNHGEVRFQPVVGQSRKIFSKAGISEPMVLIRTEESVYNALSRPWYLAAQGAVGPVWSDVYTDFKSKDLVITRASKVIDEQTRDTLGVVAVDLPLAGLQTFLSSLKTSPNGIAFLAEANGAMIAAAGTDADFAAGKTSELAAPPTARQTAATAPSAAIRLAWKTISKQLKFDDVHTSSPQNFVFKLDGQSINCAFIPIHADTGLKWVAVVLIPQSDFTGDLTGNAATTALLSLLAIAITVWLGLAVVGRVVGDIHALSDAVQRIGHGELNVAMPNAHHTEIAEITQSLSAMQSELCVDQLTGSISRSALTRHMNVLTRLYADQMHAPMPPFALLFLDLNRFKAINDTYGHQAGDSTLVEVTQRLRLAVRAGDLLARFGGDEFVVVLWRIQDHADADHVCGKIRDLLQAPIAALAHLEGSAAYTVGASIGVAYFPADARSMEDLIQIADTRMYDDKAQSKIR